VDSGDPSGEWEAAVAGEGEGLAGGGGVEADVASEGEDDQDCGDGFYTSGGVGESLFQHVDEGVAEGSLRASSMLVIVKSMVIKKTRPIRAFKVKLHIMAFGTAMPASRVSSAMWAAVSEPVWDVSRGWMDILADE
jgi:hypothetical protein